MSARLVLAAALCAVASAAHAQKPGLDIAKASQNPISSMISVPFKNNWNLETGSAERTQYVLSVDPVIPMRVSRSILVVPRFITPFINQPVGPDESTFGIGDVELQLFISPTEERNDGVVWGAGPMATFATASDDVLGAERWNAGIAAVALVMPGAWVAGFLITQQWSFAGDGNRAPVAPFLFQPFVNYNMANGWAIVSAPIMTAQWLAGDDAPVLPVGGGFSKVFAIGRQHLSGGFQAYYNAIRPDLSPTWNLKLTVTLLFPTN